MFAQRLVKGKRQNSYTVRKTVGSCSRRDNSNFLHTRATGHRETMWKEVGDAKEEQASSSVPKVKEQTDVKSSNSLEASPATRVKKSLVHGRQDVKDRRVVFDILPCVVITSLETDAFMAMVACIDMLMVRRNPAGSRRKRVLKEHLRFRENKKGQNSDPKKFILRKAGQPRLNASAGHTIKFSGRTWYEIQIRERKGPSRGFIQKGKPHERNPCAPKFQERTPEETSRQAGCDSKAAWNLARKIYELRPKIKLRFILLCRRQRHRRSYVCCGFGSFNAQC